MTSYSVNSIFTDEPLGTVLGNDYGEALRNAIGIYGELVSISRPYPGATNQPTGLTISGFTPVPLDVIYDFIAYKNPNMVMLPDIDMEEVFGNVINVNELNFEDLDK